MIRCHILILILFCVFSGKSQTVDLDTNQYSYHHSRIVKLKNFDVVRYLDIDENDPSNNNYYLCLKKLKGITVYNKNVSINLIDNLLKNNYAIESFWLFKKEISLTSLSKRFVLPDLLSLKVKTKDNKINLDNMCPKLQDLEIEFQKVSCDTFYIKSDSIKDFFINFNNKGLIKKIVLFLNTPNLKQLNISHNNYLTNYLGSPFQIEKLEIYNLSNNNLDLTIAPKTKYFKISGKKESIKKVDLNVEINKQNISQIDSLIGLNLISFKSFYNSDGSFLPEFNNLTFKNVDKIIFKKGAEVDINYFLHNYKYIVKKIEER